MDEYKPEQRVQAYELEPLKAKLEINRFLKEHPCYRVSSMSCGTHNGNFIIFVVYEYVPNSRKVGGYVDEPLIPRL